MPKNPVPLRKTVLLIEGDEAAARILTPLLESLAVDVLAAADGATGLQMALERRPDLAIVDLPLPGKDGIELIRSLRATPTLAGLPLLVITAESTVENIRETARLGVDDFLVQANVLSGAGLDRIRKLLRLPNPGRGRLK
jgi:DNA-binding response OmpR family regulator